MLWAFWWSFDDNLAAAMDMPGLGQLPIWVPFLVALGLSFQLSVGARTKE